MPETPVTRLRILPAVVASDFVASITAGLVAALLAAGSAQAENSGLDISRSSIIATFSQEGVAVEAPFAKFSGDVVYDPHNAAGSSANIEVATSSLDLGDETYSAEVRKKEWFDSATFPNATFRSTRVDASGNGAFKATGDLTIKGKPQTITVSITFAETPEGQVFDGTFDLSRRAFAIGDPKWDEVLEDKVNLRFHLVASDH